MRTPPWAFKPIRVAFSQAMFYLNSAPFKKSYTGSAGGLPPHVFTPRHNSTILCTQISRLLIIGPVRGPWFQPVLGCADRRSARYATGPGTCGFMGYPRESPANATKATTPLYVKAPRLPSRVMTSAVLPVKGTTAPRAT